MVPWVHKQRSHKPKVRRFGTFTDWTFQKVAMYVQVQKVWDVKCSETSNIRVKCSSRKLWLAHEDEKPIRLSPIISWDLRQGNLIIRLTVFWESWNIFGNPVSPKLAGGPWRPETLEFHRVQVVYYQVSPSNAKFHLITCHWDTLTKIP